MGGVDCGGGDKRPTETPDISAHGDREFVAPLPPSAKRPLFPPPIASAGESTSPPAAKRSRSGTVTSEEEEEDADDRSTSIVERIDEEDEETSGTVGEIDGAAPSTKKRPFSCALCRRDFKSARMLQQHNQNLHTDKHFVCEICSKAFRFRSNLAEHRSVHTALKPFVCKFCGKSSRLKGNLTKHILKHHKTEQLDYIGTDDIIIKKGKKSVKDPAAIDFLEKSMIVLNANGQPTTLNGQSLSPFANGSAASPYARTQRRETPSSRHSTSNMSAASDGSATPLNGKLGPILNDRCFLMSLGLDAGSLDLKAESSESDSSLVGSHNNANDQLLEKCNLLMEAEEANAESNFLNTTTTDEPDDSGEDGDQHEVITLDDREASRTPPTASGLPFGQPLASSALASAAASAFFTNFQSLASNSKAKPNGASIAATLSALNGAGNAANANGRSGGATATATTCPECGKHVRKPRDLITHLATIHGIAPSSQQLALDGSPSSTSAANAEGGVQADVRQLLQLVLEMKGSVDQVRKVEQLCTSIDGRMTQLEKRMEMTLNSIYTLVQLQTQTSTQVQRLRDDTAEQLKALQTANDH
ncbi:BMA-SYD-9, isoform h [Aphelenchoides fujianensis]|nr:BMA-SYD-9, isoform h [Aphelenchoides fujianensis]